LDYLVAGGNGFIGSNLIAYILGREPEANVINLDLSRKEGMEDYMGISQYQGRYTFKEGDVCELSSYEHYLKISDIVINCARESSRSHFHERMERFIRTNILGARVLADACVRNNVPLLHLSSDEVYGSCPFTVQRKEETAPIDPSNPYATTMAAGERLVYLSGKMSEVPLAIVRPCEVIGPNQGAFNIIPRTIKMIREGRPPVVPSKKGERYRDWIHVLDLCSALEIVIRSITGKVGPRVSEDHHDEHNPPGKTVISGTSVATTPTKGGKSAKPPQHIVSGVTALNITSENRHSLNSVVEAILSLMGSDLPIQERRDEAYRDLGYNASGKKVTYYGWQARYTDLRDMLRSTIEWYEDHPGVIDSVHSDRLMP
jgi:dTDP-glucose 4,6-dehydratase